MQAKDVLASITEMVARSRAASARLGAMCAETLRCMRASRDLGEMCRGNNAFAEYADQLSAYVGRMAEGDSVAPPLDLSCRRCGAVVDRCAKCGVAFCEYTAVQCLRDDGHVHDRCIGGAREAR